MTQTSTHSLISHYNKTIRNDST